MKSNELIQIGTRPVTKNRIIPATYDGAGNELTPAAMETYVEDAPIMGTVTRDMTADEEAAYLAETAAGGGTEPDSEISMDDMVEILGEQEYRICLLEMGVNADDL